jgi:hypothetical protein
MIKEDFSAEMSNEAIPFNDDFDMESKRIEGDD